MVIIRTQLNENSSIYSASDTLMLLHSKYHSANDTVILLNNPLPPPPPSTTFEVANIIQTLT